MCVYMRMFVKLNNLIECIVGMWRFEVENVICVETLVGIFRIWS